MGGVTLIVLIIVAMLSGCNTNLVTKHNEYNPPKSSVIINKSEQVDIINLDISFEDQKEVEELIKAYFDAWERKDYKQEWELISSNQRSFYGNFEAFQKSSDKNRAIESTKLISLRGYIPPTKTKDSITIEEVPEGMPTVWFKVSFNLKLKDHDPIWQNGVNTRFVIVEKESSGKWKIGGLATSP